MTTASGLKKKESLIFGFLGLGLQSISVSAVLAGKARGGNALGLEAINQTWFVLDTGHWLASADDEAHNATHIIHARIENVTITDGNYLPYEFMNDASYGQEVIKHYGTANVQKLKEIQKKYDLELFFERLVFGGFELP